MVYLGRRRLSWGAGHGDLARGCRPADVVASSILVKIMFVTVTICMNYFKEIKFPERACMPSV